MLYYTLAVLSSTYSVFAILFLITYLYFKYTEGIQGYNKRINRLAGTKTIVVFEVYTYVAIAAWVVLTLPWLTLFMPMGWSLMTFKDAGHGVTSYLGSMTSRQADMWFIVMFFNILGVKAAMNLMDIAAMLRKGRVRLIKIPHGRMVWMPE